jgi:tRNA threonylcarbamoyladenosine biosynthesis protein TsaE
MTVDVRESRSTEETVAIARSLVERDPGGSFYYLEGELGAGKTLFAKGVASGFGIDPSAVSSPTFALVMRHGGGGRVLYHLDLYRIESELELEELGIEEMEQEGAVLVVEWAEKMGRYRRSDAARIRIEVTGEATRSITIETP